MLSALPLPKIVLGQGLFLMTTFSLYLPFLGQTVPAKHQHVMHCQIAPFTQPAQGRNDAPLFCPAFCIKVTNCKRGGQCCSGAGRTGHCKKSKVGVLRGLLHSIIV